MNELTEKRITAIVVDDEVLGRDLVRHMAQAHNDLEIVGDCGSVKRALEMINRLRPQLVFLDVEMPSANGFRLIEALPEETRPWVIFTTAYGQHAVKAFEADALDYLQKPFDQERFDLAIDRVRDQRRLAVEAALGRRVRDLIEPARSKGGGGTESAPNFTDRITIKESGRVYFVYTKEVDFAEASGNYVELHVGTKRHLVYETMARMAAQLDPQLFLRIHRSQIVNISRIKELQPHFNGEYIVVLQSGVKLKISRGYRTQAKAVLGLV